MIAAPPPPLPLARGGEGAVLAGDHVLLARVHKNQLRDFAIPATGGDGVPVFSFTAPEHAQPSIRLAASPQRAAATVEYKDDTGDPAAEQPFSGPVLGPWSAFGPLQQIPFPWRQQLDGERVFTTEIRGPSIPDQAVVVRDPEAQEVALDDRAASSAVFGGDVMASVTLAHGEDAEAIGRRLVVANWRTGA